jgi:hypothetical protein
MKNIRQLTDAELDSVGGGQEHHHHHGGLNGSGFVGGGMSGLLRNLFLGNFLSRGSIFINDTFVFIVGNQFVGDNIGTVGTNMGNSIGAIV